MTLDPKAWMDQMRELIRSRDPDDIELIGLMLDDMEEWLSKGGHLPETVSSRDN